MIPHDTHTLSRHTLFLVDTMLPTPRQVADSSEASSPDELTWRNPQSNGCGRGTSLLDSIGAHS